MSSKLFVVKVESVMIVAAQNFHDAEAIAYSHIKDGEIEAGSRIVNDERDLPAGFSKHGEPVNSIGLAIADYF